MPENTLSVALSKLLWVLVFSIVPAVLLGSDFGRSVGIAYFVVAATLLSIHYDVEDIRCYIERTSRQSGDVHKP